MFKDIGKLFLGNKKALFGLLLLLFFALVGLLAPVIAPYDPKSNRVETITVLSEERDRSRTISREDLDPSTEKKVYSQSVTTTYERITKKLPLKGKPSSAHLLGTTHSGQDIFSQLIWGTRVSLTVGLVTGLFTTVLSLCLALIAGYFGGLVDDVISLFTNVFLVIPSLPLMIVIAAYVTVRGVIPIILILGLTSWPWPTRVL
ncbi:MAG TPA: ABC transporter permease, partial [Thermotogota bacterium]|nr:ABC transporter permease [Thermotogota bacterium]